MSTENFPTDALISQKSAEFAHSLRQAAQIANNEEDVKIATEILIQRLAKQTGVRLEAKYEFTVATGRIDSAYDRVFIEYKNPKSSSEKLSANITDKGNQKVIKQIKSRFQPLQEDLGHLPESLFGVGCDGNYFIFVRYRNNQWDVQEPVEVTQYSTERFLRVLFNLGISGKPFIPDYLARDFGADGEVAPLGIRVLYHTICHTNDPKAQTFFQQWQILFGQICGYDVNTASDKISQLAKFYGINDQSAPIRAAELLFAVHTYYALFIKLLAAEIVALSSDYFASPHRQMLQAATADKLHQELTDLESGGIFKSLGIINFLEGDLFAWYLSAWHEEIAQFIKAMVQKLDEYNPATLSEDPAESRDLLKKLYQQLFPKSLRHDLGEYYTPDWLAEHTLNRVKFEGNPDHRLLDPSCGSGTFIVMIIARIRRWFQEHRDDCNYGEKELCQKILNGVIGFDLNPLAVMAARTNYLVAMRDLIRYLDRIELPIYLCDSIMTPSEYGSDRLFTDSGLAVNQIGSTRELKTAVGPFYIPTEITTSCDLVSQYAEILEFCVQNDYTSKEFLQRCLTENLPVQMDHVHEALYRQLVKLNELNQNGIWARIIKNAFAPLFIGKVDFVVGNPPWVNWESLPPNYRDSMKPLWQEYGLFSLSASAGRLGGGKKDLSMLFVYVSVDNYLKKGGKLGFVITQSIFKTKGAGDGFRQLKFERNEQVFLHPIGIDDLSAIQVFEGATNRTAIFVCEKSDMAFAYPVNYTVWEGNSRIPQDASLKTVESSTKQQLFGAIPVEITNPNSPWLTVPQSILSGLKKVIGQSEYQAYLGVNTGGLNGCFWVKIIDRLPNGNLLIENLYDVGKIKVDKVQTVIESDLVYPLLRGRDVSRWKAEPSVHIILAQNPETRSGIPEAEMKQKYPKTFAYFKKFEPQLRQRSGYRRYYKPSDAFYSMYNVGIYTLAPWKVIWNRIDTKLQSVVVNVDHSGNIILCQETHTFVTLNNEIEAYYFTAVFNSSPADFLVRSYSASKGFASAHVLEHIGIPKFSDQNKLHLKLAEIAQKCHEARGKDDLSSVEKLEAEIDQNVAKLWGLTKDELESIQGALKATAQNKKGKKVVKAEIEDDSD